ncbi:MAG: poly(3-hydroxybutyrate) depolymerase [Glaciecola sp.]|jgi:poly(3-hydroxybutyrate) depolymerase
MLNTSLLSALVLAFVPIQDVVEHNKPASPDRWQAELKSIDAEFRPGLEFLLEFMPPADRENLSTDLVVENVEYAYKAWKDAPWHASVSEEIFFNEILPYANINERRDSWRKDFYEKFAPLVAEAKTPSEAAAILNNKVFPAVGVIYSTQRPKADQSPYESIDAGMASCTGLSVLLVDACRAVGVPARFVGTPLWADGSGNHSWVEVWDQGWHFTGAAEPTGLDLNKAWFTGRASKALVHDRERAIYAVSYKKTGTHLPMVWQPDADTVFAVNVTGRYAKQASKAPGMAYLRVRAVDERGTRIRVKVDVKTAGGDDLAGGETRDESYDANDHLILQLESGKTIELKAVLKQDESEESHHITMYAPADGSLMELRFGGKDDPSFELFTPRDLIWHEHAQHIRADRAAEMKAKELVIGELKMPFAYKVFGEKPAGGRSLYISMHGGGGAPKKVNDQQWENQKGLYEPAEGVYLAPRAATDTWNLWHQAHIDPFFDRLIENLVVFEDVNPDRVYIMGYSAGGDGVYQLAPRMADRLAAAAMMAGHPNETKADGLRNLPFTLHMGAEDAAYDRNKIAVQWKGKLAALQQSDPVGYIHLVEVHAGKGHWMDRKDAVAVPWMAEFTRELRPDKIVWLQDDVTHNRFYWLKVETPKARSRVVVEHDGQNFEITEAQDITQLTVRVDETMVDFKQDVVVLFEGKELFRGKLQPSLEMLRKTLKERGDRRGMWSAEVNVDLP